MSPSPFPDHWTPPATLGFGGLRPVRLTRQGKLLVAVSGMLLIGSAALGVFLSGKARSQNADRTLLLAQGVPASATVTRLWRTSDKDSHDMVTYSFMYAGAAYSRSVGISSRRWRSLQIGDAIPVNYLPSRPSLNHPAEWQLDVLPLWLPYPLALMFAAPALAILFPIRRQMSLLSDGRPAPGRVTGSRRAGQNQSLLFYEFRQLNGAVAKGRTTSTKPPAVGTPLCIIYDPDRPRRNAPYPFSLVRISQ